MVTVVILLPVLFALAAIAVNLAYMQAVKSKMQVVTDAATRAAGAEYIETGDESLALVAAQQMASLNPVESTVIPIAATDLEFGVSQRNNHNQAYTFSAGPNGNSVRLTTNSFASGSGTALEPFFPVFGTTFQIRPLLTATHTQTTLDVAVVVDRSGSMAFAADEPIGSVPIAAPAGWAFGDPVPPNSRWLDLVAAVGGFCNELSLTSKIEKVAVVSYASDARTDQVLTDDYTLVADSLNAVSVAFNGGATAVGDGILEGVTAVTAPMYARPWANNAIVVLSDGIHNTGTDPIAAASTAAAEQIPIYTISFSFEADQALMQQIADMTGGTHYHAVDAAQLNAAFRDIARRLPSMLTQ